MNYKVTINGYVMALSNRNGEEITESEYNTILQKIQNKPIDPGGYTYRLRADDLEWELVELPPMEEPELTADEALDIILGGGEA